FRLRIAVPRELLREAVALQGLLGVRLPRGLGQALRRRGGAELGGGVPLGLLVALLLRLVDLLQGVLDLAGRFRYLAGALLAVLGGVVAALEEDRVELPAHVADLLGVAGVVLDGADERQVGLARVLEPLVPPRRLAV